MHKGIARVFTALTMERVGGGEGEGGGEKGGEKWKKSQLHSLHLFLSFPAFAAFCCSYGDESLLRVTFELGGGGGFNFQFEG
jgi:hypothetical protein